MEKNLKLYIKTLIRIYIDLKLFYMTGLNGFNEKDLSYCDFEIKKYSLLCDFLENEFISDDYKIKLHNMYDSKDKELEKLGLELIKQCLDDNTN